MTSNMIPTRVCAFFVLLIALAVPAFSQSNKADIVGTITDSNGAGVTDREVTATKVDTGASRSSNTDSSGNYLLPLLDIGIYKVTVTKQGFAVGYAREHHAPDPGQTANRPDPDARNGHRRRNYRRQRGSFSGK